MLARAILCSFTLLLLSACGPAQTTPKAAEETPTKRPRQTSYEDKDAVSEKGKEWGGWRYQGKREDCFFTFKRQCFAEKADACKAAGCGPKNCKADSSAPAKISCKK